ncbi:MAG: hypothetical protein U9R60_11070 [Bacteroidota bacterium]|nr:hypothetical protein [Bacteroidota bacterium]
MKQPIEDYVYKHRQNMDVEEPDDQFVWEGISRELTRGKRIRMQFLRYAAAVLVLVAGGYLVFSLSNGNNKPARIITLADISEELASQENIFQLTIDQKLIEIQAYDVKQEDYARFYHELQLLDELQEEYINDLQEVGNNPRLIKAMLNYYELKIRILEKLLMEIEKHKSHENKTEQDTQVY